MTDRNTAPVRMERTIDKTKYVVSIYFNPDAKEDINEKIKRLIRTECRKTA
jgi:hypothetical protein